jgi:hypothetical protein
MFSAACRVVESMSAPTSVASSRKTPSTLSMSLSSFYPSSRMFSSSEVQVLKKTVSILNLSGLTEFCCCSSGIDNQVVNAPGEMKFINPYKQALQDVFYKTGFVLDDLTPLMKLAKDCLDLPAGISAEDFLKLAKLIKLLVLIKQLNTLHPKKYNADDEEKTEAEELTLSETIKRQNLDEMRVLVHALFEHVAEISLNDWESCAIAHIELAKLSADVDLKRSHCRQAAAAFNRVASRNVKNNLIVQLNKVKSSPSMDIFDQIERHENANKNLELLQHQFNMIDNFYLLAEQRKKQIREVINYLN